MESLIRFLWYVLVFGVTAYAVFWLGHTGWWFVLAIILSSCFDHESTREHD
jgi:hypothetical protein